MTDSKRNQNTTKLRKSLSLLVYLYSKRHQTNSWNNNPYRVIKYEIPLLSQSLQDTNCQRLKNPQEYYCPFLQSFSCIHCCQQDTGVDKLTSLIRNDYFYGFIYFHYLLKKKLSHRITKFARYMRHIYTYSIIKIRINN